MAHQLPLAGRHHPGRCCRGCWSVRGGTIVNVSSLGGRLGITTEAAYSGSKFALAGWSEAMAIDLDGTGVAVKLILPGAIDTEIWDQPDNDPPLYDGPKEPPEAIAEWHRRRHRQRALRALPARHEGGHRDEDDGHRQHSSPACVPSTGAGARAEGASSMKALLFGAPAGSRATPGPHPSRRTGGRMLLEHALRPPRDAPTPDWSRPDWVLTKTDPLGHLRIGRQARPGRLQHRRHGQPHGGLLLAPPRARA